VAGALLNILDYNLLLNGYSELLPAKGPCNGLQKMAADLNDDGAVNQFDYKLFLRVINNQGGPSQVIQPRARGRLSVGNWS
jgi:hypothetical protein